MPANSSSTTDVSGIPGTEREDNESFSQWFNRVYTRDANGQWVPRNTPQEVDLPTGWAITYDNRVEPRFTASYSTNTKRQAVDSAIKNAKENIVSEYKEINDILNGIGYFKKRIDNLKTLASQLERNDEHIRESTTRVS